MTYFVPNNVPNIKALVKDETLNCEIDLEMLDKLLMQTYLKLNNI